MRNMIICVVLLLVATPVCADEKKVWDIISWTTAGYNIGAQTEYAIRNHKLKKHLIKTGIVIGASELVKRVIHEERPNGLDNKSFWSEHAALAGVSTAYDKRVGLTFTVLTGTGRILSDNHHWWDVVVGGSVGLLVDRYIK